ncbi:MAG: chorismate synthase [Christensenellaceae bacterium]|nr:chorismate synthase [Christensenellaceae bacterium]
MKLWNNGIDIKIYGESHAPEIGLLLKGIPKNMLINLDHLQNHLNRRKSVNTEYSTKRFEPDIMQIESGIVDGVTDGSVIKISIKNTNVKSSDYKNLNSIPRPSHADYPAFVKFKGQLNMSGGGPFSGRLTAPLTVAGGIAAQILNQRFAVTLFSHITRIGIAGYNSLEYLDTLTEERVALIKNDSMPVLDESLKTGMLACISDAFKCGDSLGGVVESIAFNLPVGWGGALFDGIESKLAPLLFGIPAVKGVEFGSGFLLSGMRGSVANDQMVYKNDKVLCLTNNNGGITGGMTNGMPIVVRVAFKPTPSISIPQKSVNLVTHENVILEIKGRHDVCFVPRALVVVESALALALLDSALETDHFSD